MHPERSRGTQRWISAWLRGSSGTFGFCCVTEYWLILQPSSDASASLLCPFEGCLFPLALSISSSLLSLSHLAQARLPYVLRWQNSWAHGLEEEGLLVEMLWACTWEGVENPSCTSEPCPPAREEMFCCCLALASFSNPDTSLHIAEEVANFTLQKKDQWWQWSEGIRNRSVSETTQSGQGSV